MPRSKKSYRDAKKKAAALSAASTSSGAIPTTTPTESQIAMPPPVIPTKRCRLSDLTDGEQVSMTLDGLAILSPPAHSRFRYDSDTSESIEAMEITDDNVQSRMMRQVILDASMAADIDETVVEELQSRPVQEVQLQQAPTTSGGERNQRIAVEEDDPQLLGVYTLDDLRELFAAEGFELLNRFLERRNFFDPWVPIRDILYPTALIEEDMICLREPRQELVENVIVQYLLHVARESPIRVAVVHPIISSYFEPDRQGFFARPEGDIPKAFELTYGYRRDFEILIVPIHHLNGRHWTLAILDRRVPRFLFFDPNYGAKLDWHTSMMRFIRDTALPGQKLQGSIALAPRGSYERQRSTYDCGHYICLYAKRYVLNDGALFEERFNSDIFREQMRLVLEPIRVHFIRSADQVRPQVHHAAQVVAPSAPVAVEPDSSDTDSIASTGSIRRSSRIASRTSSVTSSVLLSNVSLEADRYNLIRSRHRAQGGMQDLRGTPEGRASNNMRQNERRHELRIDWTIIDSDQLAGPIRYRRGEGAAIISKGILPPRHDVGNFSKPCKYGCGAKLLRGESSGKCCSNGRVKLPLYPTEKPGYLGEVVDRFSGMLHPDHLNFLSNVKTYNTLVSFCSMSSYRLPTEEEPFHGHKNLVIVNGELRHHVADLDSPRNLVPAFAQLYTIDPDQSMNYRLLNPFFKNSSCKDDVVRKLEGTIRSFHPYAEAFMNAKRQYERAKELARCQADDEGTDVENAIPRFRMIMLHEYDVPINNRERGHHPGTLGLPTSDQVHVVWASRDGEPPVHKGTWITNKTGRLRKIPYWDPNLNPLVYTLIFPYGHQGYKSKTYLLEAPGKPKTHTERPSSRLTTLSTCVPEDFISELDSNDETNNRAAEASLAEIAIGDEFEEPVEGIDSVIVETGGEVEPVVDEPDNEEDVYVDDLDQDDAGYDIEDYGTVVRENRGPRKFVSRREFDRYHLFVRGPSELPISLSRHHVWEMDTLGQLYVIDTAIRQQVGDMEYYNKVQDRYHHDNQEDLRRQIERRLLRPGQVLGKIVRMSRKQVGSRRYYLHAFMNAKAIYQQVGAPQLFLTFTMNPGRQEVKQALYPGQVYYHRPDIVGRVFRQLENRLKDLVMKKGIFGKAVYIIGSREWQKRGLTHLHWVIRLHPHYFRETAEFYDDLVCAEIPDLPEENDNSEKAVAMRRLHALVISRQVHRCNSKSQCHKNGKCSKRYPKPYIEQTFFDGRNVVYRRRHPDSGGNTALIQSGGRVVRITNADIVPYSIYTLLDLENHHDLEVINSATAIGYILKYEYKGCDKSYIAITKAREGDNTIVDYDEPKAFRLATVKSSNQAFDEINGYPTTVSTYSVEELEIHLPKRNNIMFLRDATPAEIETQIRSQRSKLEAFLEQCRDEPITFAGIYYEKLPQSCTWKGKPEYRWKKRENCFTKIGRMQSVGPNQRELYALRVLLRHTPCPAGSIADPFEGLRTVDGIHYDNFYDAAHARLLIISERTWEEGLLEVINYYRSSWSVRKYFARLICNCGLGPHIATLWERYKSDMMPRARADYSSIEEEEEHRRRREEFALKHLTYLVYRDSGKLLSAFGISISRIEFSDIHVFERFPIVPNCDVLVEDVDFLLDHDDHAIVTDAMVEEAIRAVDNLKEDQRSAFNTILEPFDRDRFPTANRLSFLKGKAGYGKTTLLNAIHKHCKYVLKRKAIFCAPTGRAATLLPEGRTAHSTFGIPKNIDASSMPQMNHIDPRAIRLINADIIIWDEITQQHKLHVEYADRLLKFLMQNEKPFGGKIVILSGDFQQNLPVVVGRGLAASVEASVKHSYLYPLFKEIKLTINKRVNPDEKEFADLLNRIGSGVDTDPETNTVLLPNSMFVNSEEELRKWVFDDESMYDEERLSTRGLLGGDNSLVFEMNELMFEQFKGGNDNQVYDLYATDNALSESLDVIRENSDVFNIHTPTGLPPYHLRLKIGIVVMLIRNVSVEEGLINGTLMVVTEVIPRAGIVRCRVLTEGKSKGAVEEFAPFTFVHEDDFEPEVKFERHQFPFRVCYAMTISKSQGQTIPRIGINLKKDVFVHGQLYVGLSRAQTMDGVRIYQPAIKGAQNKKPEDPDGFTRVTNIVFKEILDE